MHSIVPVVAVEVAEVLIRKICIINFTVHTISASHNLYHISVVGFLDPDASPFVNRGYTEVEVFRQFRHAPDPSLRQNC